MTKGFCPSLDDLWVLGQKTDECPEPRVSATVDERLGLPTSCLVVREQGSKRLSGS